VEEHCKIPVVGSIPRDAGLDMTQRHLGHIPFPENDGAESIIDRICLSIAPKLDLDAIITIARGFVTAGVDMPDSFAGETKKVRVGVIRDRVFNFYYPENLQELKRNGAELIFIDSLKGSLPEIDGLLIGGGFPEFFLEELEANHKLRTDIANAIEAGLPVYAECAGLMYLCKAINWQGQRHEMVGVIPAEIELSKRPQGHGYVEIEVSDENPLFPVGMTLRGHEFHHSKLIEPGKLEFAYRVKRGHGAGEGVDGIIYKNVFAAYTHLHALGTPQWAQAFMGLVLRKLEIQPLVSVSGN
jgi:cobyrinic acid a,c-diamide synthase